MFSVNQHTKRFPEAIDWFCRNATLVYFHISPINHCADAGDFFSHLTSFPSKRVWL